jgi:integrase
MPRRREAARILGPYAEKGGQFRIIEVQANGQRTSHLFPTRKAAERKQRKLASGISTLSTREAIETWISQHEQSGKVASGTAENYRSRVMMLCQTMLDRPLHMLTPKVGAMLYAYEVRRPSLLNGKPLAADSHRHALRCARVFGKWAHKAGHLSSNPFEAVEMQGRSKQGKAQLRISEAKRLVAVAFERAEVDPLGIAAVTCLYLGLRASEAMNRLVRDLDEDGQILWIDRGKTRNAKRSLAVPDVLRPYLNKLALGRGGEELLFPTQAQPKRRRNVLWGAVARLCELAGVPHTSVHGLRGLHSTLAMEQGITAHAIAAALGHGSCAVTRRHYLKPGTEELAQIQRVSSRIVPERSEEGN